MGVHFENIVGIRWQSILILGFRFIRHQHLQMSLSGVAGCKQNFMQFDSCIHVLYWDFLCPLEVTL